MSFGSLFKVFAVRLTRHHFTFHFSSLQIVIFSYKASFGVSGNSYNKEKYCSNRLFIGIFNGFFTLIFSACRRFTREILISLTL